jgi:hypothetical protein
MHGCVCIWRYILQNYNYKLHFQNLSIYHILHVFMRTLAAENLDVCTACDPWDSNIQLTMVKDRRPQIYPKSQSFSRIRNGPNFFTSLMRPLTQIPLSPTNPPPPVVHLSSWQFCLQLHPEDSSGCICTKAWRNPKPWNLESRIWGSFPLFPTCSLQVLSGFSSGS